MILRGLIVGLLAFVSSIVSGQELVEILVDNNWPDGHVNTACVEQISDHYRIPSTLLLPIMMVENGRPGMVNENTDGSVDIGVMQINSLWLDELDRAFGITYQSLRDNGCLNLSVAAAIIERKVFIESGERQITFETVARYHSKTPSHNQRYQRLLEEAMRALIEMQEGANG